MISDHFDHELQLAILSNEITQTDLDFAEEVIIEYVKQFSDIYSLVRCSLAFAFGLMHTKFWTFKSNQLLSI